MRSFKFSQKGTAKASILTDKNNCFLHSRQLSHIWRESQDFQPFFPVSHITARISRFLGFLVTQVEFFKTLCEAKIIACN